MVDHLLPQRFPSVGGTVYKTTADSGGRMRGAVVRKGAEDVEAIVYD